MFKQISRGSIKKYSGATKKQETGRNDSSKCELPKDQPQMLNMFFEYLLDPSSFCIDMKKQDMFMSTYVYVHVYVNTQMYNVQVYVEGFTCYIYVLIYKLYGIQLDNYILILVQLFPVCLATNHSSSYTSSRRSLLPVYPQLITMYRRRTWLLPRGGSVGGGLVLGTLHPPKKRDRRQDVVFLFQVGV